MRLESISRRRATFALLAAIVLGAPAATLAVPTEAPEPDASRRADAPSMSSVWDQPPVPAPVIVVRPPEAPPPAAERTLSPNPLWEIPLASLSTTRERPIFSPSRRPPPPVVAAAPPALAPPPPPKPVRAERPQLSLVGTVDGGEESFAIFVDPANKGALRLRIGDDYQGWKLRSVQGREATLERDQQTTILSLPQPGAGALGPARGRVENVAAQRGADLPPQRDPRR
jgi:general secretion pathway protein N